MKKILLMILMFSSLYSISQIPPEAFNYSAVLRGNNGQALPNHVVSLRFSILKGDANGPIQYQEINIDTTNQWGSISLSIGYGQVIQGNFSSINWGIDSYYLQIELDDNGGSNFQFMGTQKFLSVPYALYARSTANQNIQDTSNTNEIQTLSISDNTIYLSLGGGNVVLPHIPENISELYNDAGYITHVDDGDTSSINELQILSLSNDTIFLSGGGFVKLPASFAGVNTDEQQLSISNDTISITNGGFVTIPNHIGHYSGEIYGGGIVFWVTPDGQHGLVASLIDLDNDSGTQWGLYNTLVPNCSSSTDGLSNTSSIVSAGCLTSDAAGLCVAYTGGGFSDWYLPSYRELALLAFQDILIDYILDNDNNTNTIGLSQEFIIPFYGHYWSSTQANSGSSLSYAFNAGSSSNQPKTNSYKVRAVRKF